MSYTTAIHAIPAPTQLPPGAGPDVPADLKAMADHIDTRLTPYGTVANAAALPAAGKAGRRMRALDTGAIHLDIGASWVVEKPKAGDGVAVAADGALSVDLAATPGLEISSAKLRAAVDGTTVERTAGGQLGVKDSGITAAKIAAALKPSGGAAAATEALRALGTTAGTAAAGDDARIPSSTAKTRIESITTFVATLLDDADASSFLTTLGISTFIKTLLDDVDAATARTTLGAQPLDATLSALAALVTANDKMIYATGVDTFALADLTAAGRALIDDASASAQLTTLGVSTFIKTLLDDPDAATAQATLGITASPDMSGVYRTILAFAGAKTQTFAGLGVGPHLFGDSASSASLGLAIDGGVNPSPAVFYLDPADFAVAGKTTKYRIRATVISGDIAPGVTITAKLYPFTSFAGGFDYTLGAGVVPAAVATPAVNSRGQADSGDVTAPAAGYYALGFTQSGAETANSLYGVSAQLQVRNV